MRSLPIWSTVPLAALIVALAGCPGSDSTATSRDDSRDGDASGASRAGAGGATVGNGKGTAGDGAFDGSGDPEVAGAGGAMNEDPGGSGGSGASPPSPQGGTAGAAGSGAAGSNTDGLGGADLDGCVGKFQDNAPWPAAGRCSARQGNAPVAGPTNFGGLASILLDSAIAASPVIDAAGDVYVVNAKGLFKLDKLLTKKTALYDKGAISSAPVITADDRVIALTEKGKLLAGSVTGSTVAPIQFDPAKDEAESGWVSSLALDASGRVIFASPKGNVYIVDPQLGTTDIVPLGKDITVGASAISISTQGDFAIGTNKGLFVLPHGQTTSKQIPIPGAAVSRTPVFIPKSGKSVISAVYADDAGVVHNVSVDEAGVALDQPSTSSPPPFGLGPGAPAVLAATPSGGAARVFIGDGSLLKLLDTSDGPAVIDSKTIALSAAGPITAAAATDTENQLFVPSTDGNMYRLTRDPKELTGFVIGDSFLTQGPLTTAPALAGNRLYFGSADKYVYMITEEPGPLSPESP